MARYSAPPRLPTPALPAHQRVVVTGLGVVSPVGNSVATSWQSLIEGRSGIGPITLFDASPYPVQIAGEVRGLADAVAERIDAKEARRMDRFSQLALVATHEAMADARLVIDAENADRVGVVLGTAAGGLTTIIEQEHILHERGQRRVSPFFIPNMLPDAASGHVAIVTGARGPNMSVAGACGTGGHAIGEAAEMIRRGDADAMIAGAADATILPLIVAGFSLIKILANDPDPTRACRPFDSTRCGFVMSEAGAVVILESLAHAQARDARIYAELAGYAATNDAFDMVAQHEEGFGIVRAMQRAVEQAGVGSAGVDYINAHGTGTLQNDRVETQAIKRVFGDHARRLAVSSTKSMTGHMMGASGALEAIICTLAVAEGVLPPTINYAHPDPDCDLDYVPNQARRQSVRAALSNSIGLGGHNSSLLFAAWAGA